MGLFFSFSLDHDEGAEEEGRQARQAHSQPVQLGHMYVPRAPPRGVSTGRPSWSVCTSLSDDLVSELSSFSKPPSLFPSLHRNPLCCAEVVGRDLAQGLVPLGIEWWTGSRAVFGKWRQDCELTFPHFFYDWVPEQTIESHWGISVFSFCVWLCSKAVHDLWKPRGRKERASKHRQEHTRLSRFTALRYSPGLHIVSRDPTLGTSICPTPCRSLRLLRIGSWNNPTSNKSIPLGKPSVQNPAISEN